MAKRIFHALNSALRHLLRNWTTLIILLVLYLAMLGAVYVFLAAREATVAQLIVSFALAIAAPLLFLIIQTMAARFRDGQGHAWALLGGSLRDFWKLLVIGLPIIAIAVLAIYLFARIETSTPAAVVREAVRGVAGAPRTPAPKPQAANWQSIAITALKYLLFGLVLPLAAVHLWTATARDGVKEAFKNLARILARALAPQAVVTYAIGFVFFAVAPYFLIVTRTPVAGWWIDLGLFVARLLLAVVISLTGWVVTLDALGELTVQGNSERAAQAGETGHVPAEA